MEPSFIITKTFLKSVIFDSPNTPELFFNNQGIAEMPVSISTNIAEASSEEPVYLVDLLIEFSPHSDDQTIFNLKLAYSAIVEILDYTLSQEERMTVLQNNVPDELFTLVSCLVREITEESGSPPVQLPGALPHTEQSDTSSAPDDDTRDEIEDETCVNTEPLGFSWIVRDVISTPEGATFLETLQRLIGCDFSVYENLPMYKYYYRFLSPVDYRHPMIDECLESYWPLLFQLMFAEADDVELVMGDDSLPDLFFSFCEYQHRTVSSLTNEDLKQITSGLAVKAFTHTCVGMYGIQFDELIAEKIPDNRPPLKEELFALYHYNGLQKGDETAGLVEQFLERIRNYDIQTFPYRFLT